MRKATSLKNRPTGKLISVILSRLLLLWTCTVQITCTAVSRRRNSYCLLLWLTLCSHTAVSDAVFTSLSHTIVCLLWLMLCLHIAVSRRCVHTSLSSTLCLHIAVFDAVFTHCCPILCLLWLTLSPHTAVPYICPVVVLGVHLSNSSAQTDTICLAHCI